MFFISNRMQFFLRFFFHPCLAFLLAKMQILKFSSWWLSVNSMEYFCIHFLFPEGNLRKADKCGVIIGKLFWETDSSYSFIFGFLWWALSVRADVDFRCENSSAPLTFEFEFTDWVRYRYQILIQVYYHPYNIFISFYFNIDKAFRNKKSFKFRNFTKNLYLFLFLYLHLFLC